MSIVDEFNMEGKNFIYIDFGNFRKIDEMSKLMEDADQIIKKYPLKSLYAISNVENIKVNTKFHEIVTSFFKNNGPYVKYSVIIGSDGVKKLMIEKLIKASGRKNMHFAFTKEQAIKWLLKQP